MKSQNGGNTVDTTLVQAADLAGETMINSLAAGNAAAIAALYSKDARAYVPNAGTVSGRDNLLAAWQGGIDMGVRKITLARAELVQDDKTAFETGTYAILNEEGTVTEQGNSLLVWLREEGAWKWHRHIWNHVPLAGGV